MPITTFFLFTPSFSVGSVFFYIWKHKCLYKIHMTIKHNGIQFTHPLKSYKPSKRPTWIRSFRRGGMGHIQEEPLYLMSAEAQMILNFFLAFFWQYLMMWLLEYPFYHLTLEQTYMFCFIFCLIMSLKVMIYFSVPPLMPEEKLNDTEIIPIWVLGLSYN